MNRLYLMHANIYQEEEQIKIQWMGQNAFSDSLIHQLGAMRAAFMLGNDRIQSSDKQRFDHDPLVTLILFFTWGLWIITNIWKKKYLLLRRASYFSTKMHFSRSVNQALHRSIRTQYTIMILCATDGKGAVARQPVIFRASRIYS